VRLVGWVFHGGNPTGVYVCVIPMNGWAQVFYMIGLECFFLLVGTTVQKYDANRSLNPNLGYIDTNRGSLMMQTKHASYDDRARVLFSNN